MFAPFMMNAWIVGTMVAVVAGVVGFFVVMRGSAFAADAVPQGAFAGAAGASLIGVSTLLGLSVFALAGALGIGLLGRRGRHDVATALKSFAHDYGITQLVMGKSRSRTGWKRFSASLVDRLSTGLPGVDVILS